MASASEGSRFNRRLPDRLIKYAAPLVGALALAGAKPSPSPSSAWALEGGGLNTAAGFVEDIDISRQVVSRVDELGGNTLEVQIPYTQGGIDVTNDREELCNTANAVAEYNEEAEKTGRKRINLVLRNQMYYRDGRMGFVPRNSHELLRLYARDINLIYTLKGPHGCAPKLKEIYYAPLNEPGNHPNFNDRPYSGKEYVAPADMIKVNQFVYARLPKEARERGLEMKIIIGELSQRNVLRFLAATRQVMLAKKISAAALADVVAVHWWFNGPDADHMQTAANYLKNVSQALDDTFPGLEKWLSEVGSITTVPPQRRHQYEEPRASLKPMTPHQQGRALSWILAEAARNGFVRVNFFRDQDDGTYQTSGLRWVDGVKKAGYPAVQQRMKQLVPQK